jgi:hypothetical protein
MPYLWCISFFSREPESKVPKVAVMEKIQAGNK